MSDSQKMILNREYVTRFFQELYAQADTEVSDSDSPDVVLAKLTKQMSIAHRITELTNTQAYRDIETYLMCMAREHEDKVFEAILKKNEADIQAITIARTGIIQFFECFEAAAVKIENIAMQINELKDVPVDDPPDADSDNP